MVYSPGIVDWKKAPEEVEYWNALAPADSKEHAAN